MPRESDRAIFLRLYEQEVEREIRELEAELDLELEIELEIEARSILDEFDNGSDTSMESTSSSSISSLSSTDSSLSSSSSSDSSNSDNEFDEEPEPGSYMESLDQLLPHIISQRYLVERIAKPKSRDFVTRVLPHLDDHDFKEQYRMFPSSFLVILERIHDHPVFHTATQNRPQEPPYFQLQVALKRFGTESSSASGLAAIAKHFGIGKVRWESIRSASQLH